MIPLLYWLNQEVPLGACDQPFSCNSMMFLVLLQTTERKLLLYWPPCSPTLPNILRKLADSVLLFVYSAHSSMSIAMMNLFWVPLVKMVKLLFTLGTPGREVGCVHQIYKLCFVNRLYHHGVLKWFHPLGWFTYRPTWLGLSVSVRQQALT